MSTIKHSFLHKAFVKVHVYVSVTLKSETFTGNLKFVKSEIPITTAATVNWSIGQFTVQHVRPLVISSKNFYQLSQCKLKMVFGKFSEPDGEVNAIWEAVKMTLLRLNVSSYPISSWESNFGVHLILYF